MIIIDVTADVFSSIAFLPTGSQMLDSFGRRSCATLPWALSGGENLVLFCFFITKTEAAFFLFFLIIHVTDFSGFSSGVEESGIPVRGGVCSAALVGERT